MISREKSGRFREVFIQPTSAYVGCSDVSVRKEAAGHMQVSRYTFLTFRRCTCGLRRELLTTHPGLEDRVAMVRGQPGFEDERRPSVTN